jgi:hypothetical protein
MVLGDSVKIVISRLRAFLTGMRVFQIITVLLILAFAIYRTVKSTEGPDAVVVGLLVLAVVVGLFQFVSEINLFGGNSIKFKEVHAEVAKVGDNAAIALMKMVLLIRRWSDVAARSCVVRVQALSRAEYDDFTQTSLSTTIDDALEWLGKPGERIRVSIWNKPEKLLPTEEPYLQFFFCNAADAEEKAILKSEAFTLKDEDFIGSAWREGAIINVGDAPKEWRAFNPTGVFHGLMFVPIRRGGKPWGLMEFDRIEAEPFRASAEVLAAALCNMVATVVGS